MTAVDCGAQDPERVKGWRGRGIAVPWSWPPSARPPIQLGPHPIIARQAGRESPVQCDGRGQVYMEFGHCQVARLDLTSAAGRPPTCTFEAPSTDLTGPQSEFVTTRIQCWLGRGAGRRQ
jgi:hypothetical protein